MRVIVLAMAGLLAACGFMSSAEAATPRRAACCRVPAGTEVKVELVDDVSTKTNKAGDVFALRLAEPLVIRGRIVAPKGAMGQGRIIDASKPGMGGKAAKLVLAASYVQQGRVRLRLQGLQVAANGRGYANTANVVGLAGIAFAPLGFAALAIQGGDVVLPAGTTGMAKIAVGVTLRSLGPAPASVADASIAPPEPVQGPIGIPPPPPGQGQVVFFRAKSLLGTGQWFNVREDGKALGKLVNGAYFVDVTEPGLHTYAAKTEPEFNDKLKLQIDPGETYFVEGVLTKGVIIGAADLTPSTAAAFNKAAKDLKLAPPPGDDKDEKAQTAAASPPAPAPLPAPAQ
jgi:hypothetical protein